MFLQEIFKGRKKKQEMGPIFKKKKEFIYIIWAYDTSNISLSL